MREMGPSFVTVAAQGFYRSRVRNCYPLPLKESFKVLKISTSRDFLFSLIENINGILIH